MSQLKYEKNWENSVVEEYIKQESQEKSPDVFLETHLPITHIRADILIGGSSKFISEKQLLEHITQSGVNTEKNRIYLLKGEVGSGKSHLCQWLEYQLNGTQSNDPVDDSHVAIHISRNNTRLADILDKLYEHIDIEHDDVDDITAYDNYPEVVDTLLSMLGTFDKDLTFEDDTFEFEEFLADNPNGDDLRSYLIENLKSYRDNVESEEKEQEFELLTRKQFGKICLSTFGEGFSGERGDDIYPGVRLAISERLMKNIGIENFQDDLEEISKQYHKEGKRPVLICEDVTTFNVLKDDLLDHIFELGDGSDDDHGFDIVLGYTTGWETEKADDALTTGDLSFMKERAQGYLSMTDRDGQAYFLRQGSMPVRLVNKYLDVIKHHSDVDVVDIDEELFDNVYPFNKRFLVRAYRHLQEEGDSQQTPRILLYHVVADALLSNIPPFERAGDNTHLDDFAAPMSVQNLSSGVKRLAKWYGRMDGGDVVLDSRIPESFGVDIPEELLAGDGMIRLDAMYDSGLWEVTDEDLDGFDPDEFMESEGELETDDDDTAGKGEDDTDGSESGSDDSGDSSGSSNPVVQPGGDDGDDDGREEQAKRIGQFQDWIGTGESFPSSNLLEEGVRAALDRFDDPTRLANENSTADGTLGIYYAPSGNPPVRIVGEDKRKSVQIEVPFNDGKEQLYLNLFRYGLDGEFPESTNFDQIRGWSDEKTHDLRQQMRDNLESHLPDDTPTKFEIEELLILSQVLVYNFRTGRRTIEQDDVFETPDLMDESPFHPRNGGQFDLPSGLKEGYKNLNTRRSDIRGLCEGFFLLKENFVDYERLNPALRNVAENPEEYIDAAAKINVSDVQGTYRIGSSVSDSSGSTRVKALFKAVSDYAAELQKLGRRFDTETIEEDVQTVESLYSYSHTAADLSSLYDRLMGCFDHLEDSLQTEWVDIGNELEDGSLNLNLSDFGNSLNEFKNSNPKNGLETVQLMYRFNKSKENQDAWKVYQAIQNMIEKIEEHDEPDGAQFSEELRQTDEFDSLKRQRESTIATLEDI